MSEHEPAPRLIAYKLPDLPEIPIVPASKFRAWMNGTIDHHAYRCLPMTMANQAGWFMLNPYRFVARWDGSSSPQGLVIEPMEKEAPPKLIVKSHFGYGILTWKAFYLFRTSPNYNLLVRGPANWLKDGVQALEGLVETDWTLMPFTMNWKITRPNHFVVFDKNEPFCMLVPQRRHELESFRAELAELSDDTEVEATTRQMRQSRKAFMRQLREHPSEMTQKGELHYFRGTDLDGERFEQHQTRLTLASFVPMAIDSDADVDTDSQSQD